MRLTAKQRQLLSELRVSFEEELADYLDCLSSPWWRFWHRRQVEDLRYLIEQTRDVISELSTMINSPDRPFVAKRLKICRFGSGEWCLADPETLIDEIRCDNLPRRLANFVGSLSETRQDEVLVTIEKL